MSKNKLGFIKKILLSICAPLILSGVAIANEYEIPRLTRPVLDEAQVLDEQSVFQIETLLRDLKDETSTQVVVYTVKTLNGTTVEDLGIKAADKWKLGQKGKVGSADAKLDRGLILILALKERKVRIEVGQGLEASLTDIESKQIIQNVMAPFLKESRYDLAFKVGLVKILEKTDPQFNARSYFEMRRNSRVNHSQDKDADVDRHPFSFMLFLFLLFLIFILRIFGSFGGGGFGGFGGGFGGGGFGSGGSGGYSGGGGGFSGGGASGDW